MATLLDLMQVRTRDDFRPFVMDREAVFTVEQALEGMRGLIEYAADWTDITGTRCAADTLPLRRSPPHWRRIAQSCGKSVYLVPSTCGTRTQDNAGQP